MSDDAFRLGWFDDPKLAGRCLTTLAEKAALYKGQGVFEDDTRAIFVEPLLRGLGWDTLDHNQVDREFPRGKGNIIGDIWLGGTDQEKKWRLAAAIEVKALDASDLERAYIQLRSNVLKNLFNARAGSDNERRCLQLRGKAFVRGVVTNGGSWIVYDFHPIVPESHTPVCRFDLQDGSEHVANFVRVIGRHHLLKELGLF